jgi:hypothetical protein
MIADTTIWVATGISTEVVKIQSLRQSPPNTVMKATASTINSEITLFIGHQKSPIHRSSPISSRMKHIRVIQTAQNPCKYALHAPWSKAVSVRQLLPSLKFNEHLSLRLSVMHFRDIVICLHVLILNFGQSKRVVMSKLDVENEWPSPRVKEFLTSTFLKAERLSPTA